MLLISTVALLSMVGGSVARITNAGDDTTENVEEKQREVACKSYDRVIAPKIAQNMNGNKEGYNEGVSTISFQVIFSLFLKTTPVTLTSSLSPSVSAPVLGPPALTVSPLAWCSSRSLTRCASRSTGRW